MLMGLDMLESYEIHAKTPHAQQIHIERNVVAAASAKWSFFRPFGAALQRAIVLILRKIENAC